MASVGPIPKRSDERVRRNLADPITKIGSAGQAPQPPLGISFPHALVGDLWESMRTSAQSKFYENSDWAYAKVTLFFLNDLLNAQKKSPMMLTAINQMLATLLLTEGERRRVRIEVERNEADVVSIDVARMFKERAQKKA
jgi:hypothetical protein